MASSFAFRRWLHSGFWLTVCFLSQGWETAQAQQIQFVEEFVLSADRAKALQTLVPGTEDFFYDHALDQQLRRTIRTGRPVVKAVDRKIWNH
jgi:hypothetical protein